MSLDVGRIVLVRGGSEVGAGFSAMEAVAFAAGEAWTERPRCASPTITEWMIAWNDGLDDRARQELRRYIWRLVGSKGTPAQERARRWMAADWLVRGYAPAWLSAAHMSAVAQALSDLRMLRSPRDVNVARRVSLGAARAARAARDDAWRRAADQVDEVSSWETAGAVWAAIAEATWAAAGSAARAVVWSSTDALGPGSPNNCVVWDAVCDAAADAAAAIAWSALDEASRHPTFQRVMAGVGPGDDAGSLARDITRTALASTGISLQASAHVVVDRMLAVTEAHQPTVRPFDMAPRHNHRWPRHRR